MNRSKKYPKIPIKMDGTYAYCPFCRRSIHTNLCLSCEKKGKGLWNRLKIDDVGNTDNKNGI